jgi:hypothetical protein
MPRITAPLIRRAETTMVGGRGWLAATAGGFGDHVGDDDEVDLVAGADQAGGRRPAFQVELAGRVRLRGLGRHSVDQRGGVLRQRPQGGLGDASAGQRGIGDVAATDGEGQVVIEITMVIVGEIDVGPGQVGRGSHLGVSFVPDRCRGQLARHALEIALDRALDEFVLVDALHVVELVRGEQHQGQATQDRDQHQHDRRADDPVDRPQASRFRGGGGVRHHHGLNDGKASKS